MIIIPEVQVPTITFIRAVVQDITRILGYKQDCSVDWSAGKPAVGNSL